MNKLQWLCICCFAILSEIKAKSNPDSLLYFEHHVFKASNIEEKNDFLWQKYFYQKSKLQFSEALKTINRIIPKDNQSEFDLLYEKALMHYLLQEYELFEQMAFQAKNFTLVDDNKMLLLNVLMHIERFEFEQARELLLQSCSNAASKQLIDSVFDIKPYKKQKSENKAVLLSTFLPGTGQWYSGNFKHGAINAVIILGLLGWGAYNFLDQYYVTSLFTGFFTAYTFYDGGIRKAGSLARQYNKKQQIELRNKALYLITLLN